MVPANPRKMSAAEMEIAISLAATEGWNPGISDAAIFHGTDPQGYFMIEADGALAGCISGVRYDDRFGFLGLYIMKPEHRGKGMGMKLWTTALDYLEGCNVGLDGVVAQQDNYRKSGFVFAHNNIRFEYRVTGGEQADGGMQRLAEIPFDELINFDAELFPARRAQFLKPWIEHQGSVGLAAYGNDKLEGYVLLRKCMKGYKAGPLFAKDVKTARALFLSAVSGLPAGTEVYLDVPEPNKAAMQLAAMLKMEKVFETARMYNKSTPDMDLERIFGITSFELG